MTATVYDTRQCELGEGPLWHPERQQLYWFDILGKRLLSREAGAPKEWRFAEHASAAAWIDRDTLLVATETQLCRFDLATGKHDPVCALEPDILHTRSNDGRADPMGGFWIGTIGKNHESNAGAIYRYYRGELRQLYRKISTPNAICFAPDGRLAYFTDTPTRRIMAQPLDEHGWPKGTPRVHLDLNPERLNPDGAVTDAQGNLWCAQWGAARIAGYRPDGSFIEAVAFPARHTSCPAFGGPDLTTLYCTTAQENIAPETLAAHPENGQTFAVETIHKGLPEPQVIL